MLDKTLNGVLALPGAAATPPTRRSALARDAFG